ncbi:hypothetical protein F4806DRAFT_465922 [Annulohypoxylon nitens]|nr:hypothetical protein F4806DRAFT_465922 [Annulohypoxylon nitens]
MAQSARPLHTAFNPFNPGTLAGHGYEQPFSTIPQPQVHAANSVEPSQQWIAQFSSQHYSPEKALYQGSHSSSNYMDYRPSPTFGTPPQAPIAPMSTFPAVPMYQEPVSVAGSADAQVEFDNALKGWIDSMGADESRLFGAMDTSAPTEVPAPAPVARPAVPEQGRTRETEKARAERVRDEDSKLAIAAQEIINSVSDERSDKFQQSEFLSLMRRIASMDLVVRDNALVNPDTLETKGTGVMEEDE